MIKPERLDDFIAAQWEIILAGRAFQAANKRYELAIKTAAEVGNTWKTNPAHLTTKGSDGMSSKSN